MKEIKKYILEIKKLKKECRWDEVCNKIRDLYYIFKKNNLDSKLLLKMLNKGEK